MANLEENTSLVTALTEIEKKVGQAEIDRDNLKTNLSAKGVDVATTNKMQVLVEKVNDIEVSKHLPWAKNDVWIQAEKCTNSVCDATMSAVNGRAYLIGGKIGSNRSYDNSCRCYDSTNNTWSDKAKFSGTDARFTSQSIGDCIYVFGGINDTKKNTRIYNTLGDYWTSGSPSPTDSLDSTSASLDNNIYVMSSYVNYYHKNECYNVITNTWTTKSSIPDSGSKAGICCIIGKIIYFTRGTNLYKYDTDSDLWSLVENIENNNFYFDRTRMVSHENYIYFFSSNSTKRYNTVNTVWEERNVKHAHPNPDLQGFSVCKLNDVVFAVGGYYGDYYAGYSNTSVSRYYLI